MAQVDWSDLRYALAIGTGGSLAAAARRLGVNHTTVLRRLDALEQQLGARLFERHRTGYQPTEAGQLVLEQARRMADQADEIERRVMGRDREPSGQLRVTTAFVVMEHLLPAPLASFARHYPGIEVEVTENAFLIDLARRSADSARSWSQREADVAVRISAQVADHLVGRPLGPARCRVYALRGAPDLPQTVTPLHVLLKEAPWVAFEHDAQSRVYDRWMRQHLAEASIRVRVDIFNAVAAMLHTGIGVGILPTFMEDRHPSLIPVSDPIPELEVPVWMLTHPDLRDTTRVRLFMRHVGDAISERLRRGESGEAETPPEGA
ncbi:LysR family transcriptional regulator [Ideonella livida]|uniref:LysR family transcriptional regulator n=1 Tax=Ideonella livida TaxID=2707176 RepID=A0A7C9TKR1_9BURK|nr:LysR family transcriptional regulator [Ideonella livida]NDY92999.1 LysR family transcriptional regulator [Ideonella livida]